MINAEVRNRVPRKSDFATTISEALFVIITVGRDNRFLRASNESPGFRAYAARSDSRVFRLNRGWWQDIIERAAQNEELAADLTLDEILAWLTTQQSLLQQQLYEGQIDEQRLRHVLRRFVVAPLVAR